MSRGQRKVKLKILGFGGVIHFLGQFFVKNAKNDPRTFLNGPNRTNFGNRENTENAENSEKNCLFYLQNTESRNSVIFLDIYLKFCTHMHLTEFFHMYSGSSKIRKIVPKFLESSAFSRSFFPNFENFHNFEHSR